MKVINKVEGTQTIPWSELKTYEFNNLKDDSRDTTKLENDIINEGFVSPFYIWKDHRYVLDGKGRKIALTNLEEKGAEIPDLPFVSVQAETLQHAKKLVLSYSSVHGEVTQESWDVFALDMADVRIEDYNVPDTYFLQDFSKSVYQDQQAQESDIVKGSKDQNIQAKPDVDDASNAFTTSEDDYEKSTIRQVVLYFDVDGYEEFINKTEPILQKEGLNDNTELFNFLIKKYEGNNSKE